MERSFVIWTPYPSWMFGILTGEWSSLLKVGDIREFMRLMDETSIHELQVEAGDVKLVLKKAPLAERAVTAQTGRVDMVQSASVQAPLRTESVEAPESAPVAPYGANSGGAIISSPMVGTFYRSSTPSAPPYVDVGSRITEKTVVCIVEAMKLMNEIEADVRGEIVEVLAENGQLVEFGQPLFRVNLA